MLKYNLLRIYMLMGLYKYWGMIWVWKWILLKKDFHKWWRWKGFSMLKPHYIHIYIKRHLYISQIKTNYPPLKQAVNRKEVPLVAYRLINQSKHPSLPQLSYLLLYRQKEKNLPIYLNLGQELFYTLGSIEKTTAESEYVLKLYLLRKYKIRKKRAVYSNISSYQRQIGYQLYEYLLKDLHKEGLHINDLLSTYPLSRSSFFKIFKLVIGVSPNIVKRDRRLINFKNRLLETNHPIYNLFLESGFKSRSYLHRLFQKTYEMSPQQFRNTYKK